MKYKLRPVLSISVSLLSAVAANAQSAVPQPTVFDKNGKTVGSLLKSNVVLIRLPSQQLIQANAYYNGFLPSSPYQPANLYFYYESTNCTGTGYFDATLYPSFAVIDPRNPAFFVFAGPNPTTVHFGSYRIVSAGSQACLKNISGEVYGALPERIALNRFGFAPPFAVRSQ